MYSKQPHYVLLRLSPVLVFLSIAGMPAFAQDTAKTASEKWRPKDGVYGSPRKDPNSLCRENEGVLISLAKKRVSISESSCDITGVSDTSPGAIRLDMTCTDVNLAISLYPRDPHAEDRELKELMLLDKIDEKTMFIRMTSNGKFHGPRSRISYCPDEQQEK